MELKYKLNKLAEHNPRSLTQYTKSLDQWIVVLLSKYKEYMSTKSLLELIQTKRKIAIASDGSKTKTKSGDA